MALQVQGLALHVRGAWLSRLQTLPRIQLGELLASSWPIFSKPFAGGVTLPPYGRRPRSMLASVLAAAVA